MRILAIAAALVCAPLFVTPALAQADGVTSDSTKSGSAATARIAANAKDGNAAPSVKAGGVKANGTKSRVIRTASVQRPVRRAAVPNELQMKCLKQAGASLDPYTKRWMFYVTERDGASRTDMYRLCLAGGDRQKAKTIAVPEIQINPSGVPYKPYP